MTEDSLALHMIPGRARQPRELVQASWVATMVIWDPFDLQSRYSESWFVPIEVLHEIVTGNPGVVQVLDVNILRSDLPCFFEVGLVWIGMD